MVVVAAQEDAVAVRTLEVVGVVFRPANLNAVGGGGTVLHARVNAIARVAARDEDSVQAPLQALDYEVGAHPRGTGDAHDPDVGRVLEPAYSSQVCSCVAAPVAEESDYFGFPTLVRFHPFLSARALTCKKSDRGCTKIRCGYFCCRRC